MTWAWAAAQGCVVIEFLYPCAFWLNAAFRPEDAERVRTFHDMGWLPFLGIVCTGMFQMVVLGIAVLRPEAQAIGLPRWFAYFQFWCALAVGLTFGVWIFHTGPMAYNGIVGFWIPVIGYFTWIIVSTAVVSRVITLDDNRTRMDSAEDRIADLERRLRNVGVEDHPQDRVSASDSVRPEAEARIRRTGRIADVH